MGIWKGIQPLGRWTKVFKEDKWIDFQTLKKLKIVKVRVKGKTKYRGIIVYPGVAEQRTGDVTENFGSRDGAIRAIKKDIKWQVQELKRQIEGLRQYAREAAKEANRANNWVRVQYRRGKWLE